MFSWINNPWIIGIGGGILSGFVVTIISHKILSRRDRKEYIQKVLSANREVIYAIRPGIAEGIVPSKDVVNSLLSSTARKYGVDEVDLLKPHEIAQELTKEVMDSSFISPKAKEDYCNHLKNLIIERKELKIVGFATKMEISQYRSKMVQVMSMMMGFLVASMTMLLSFSKTFEGNIKYGIGALSLPAIIAIALALIFSLISIFYRMLKIKQTKKDISFEVKNLRDKTKLNNQSNHSNM